jgi:hypothetical protein
VIEAGNDTDVKEGDMERLWVKKNGNVRKYEK